jgi:hypothetical protein
LIKNVAEFEFVFDAGDGAEDSSADASDSLATAPGLEKAPV